jgi:hypothetical protein
MKRKTADSTNDLPFSPVLAAVRLAGGVSKVAQELGLKRPSVYAWVHRGRLINDKTFEYAVRLHELSGVRVDQLLCGIDIGDPKFGGGRK